MKKVFMSIWLVSYMVLSSFANTDINTQSQFGSAYLNGTIDGSTFNEKEIEVVVFDNYFKLRRELDARNFRLNKNKPGGIKIDSIARFTYLSIGKSNDIPFKIKQIWFFLMPGDNVQIDIRGDNLNVSGNGADRIRCLWEIHGRDWDYLSSIEKTITPWHHNLIEDTAIVTDWVNYFQSQYLRDFEKIDYLYEAKIEILNQYRQMLTRKEYEFIKFECQMWQNDEKLRVWREMPIRKPQAEIARNIIIRDEFLPTISIPSNKEIAERSLIFSDLIAMRELIWSQRAEKEKIVFSDFLSKIKQTYDKPIFDKLMVSIISMTKVSPYREQISSGNLERIMGLVEDERYKKIIQGYHNVLTNKVDLNSYHFTNTDGDPILFNEYQGKLIIADFWFTGCSNCIILAKSMAPIVNKYSDNPNIIFLSINMDKSEKLWQQSLQFGAHGEHYTHEESVNLSTYPLGFQHPIVEALNITGAPQILIVDKKGRILEMNPPRPIFQRPETVTAFAELIDKYLKNQ